MRTSIRNLCVWGILVFLLSHGQALKATDILDPSLIPPPATSMQASVSSPIIAPGEALQIVVSASFADGSTRDVTSESGINFSIFPKTAGSIDETGVFTALEVANVIIWISYNGVGFLELGEVEFAIRSPGDRDGDGMEDSYEVANGLNPDFAGDAEVDTDRDGLRNKAEHVIGTDPRNPDTDGDRHEDGAEVSLGTDPLVPDIPPTGGSNPLDSACFVSALNRTAQVEPDGTWVLPNVPANLGRVRLRATCIRDGVVTSGQSEFVDVPANGVIQVSEIRFDLEGPVPARLVLTAPQTSLTSVGQIAQLTATAEFSAAPSIEVTLGEAGTNYRSSSSATATVSPDGLVTAVASGVVLVSAINDGALGLLRLSVTLSGDTDGDGLPDDFELAAGLDPNDPADALLDPDRDGLSTLEEFQLGLDPFDGDSDDDGLLDGEEVNTWGTDPLLFDTDGDGLSDGLEVETGSDPLDPASFNLVAALTSINLAPSSFTMVFNTVLGESSRQLLVTGDLIDGTSLDITSDFYGTSYSSSDLTIASFGVDPGRVFAGADGAALVTASVGGFSADAAVSVETFSPTALSYLPLAGGANSIEVEGEIAYVLGDFLLSVVDVRDLEAPFLASELRLPGIGAGFGSRGRDLVQEAGRVYCALGFAGIRIADVSLPQSPQQVGAFAEGDTTWSLALRGTTLFAGGPGVLRVYDVGDPAAPVELGQTSFTGGLDELELMGDFLVGAAGRDGVLVFDVSDPSAPALVGRSHTRAGGSRAAGLAVDGAKILVADGASHTLGGLRMLEAGEPAALALVGSTSDSFGLTAVELDGTLALASDYFFVNAVPIFQLTDGDPIFQSALDFSGPPSFRDDNGTDLALQEGAVFLLAGRGLHIGRYRIPSDTEGIAPQVTLTAPAPEDVVPGRTFLTVEALAEDDQAVRAVEFYADGELLRRDLSSPYSASFLVPGDATALTLSAVAIDEGGNVATSEAVTVTVAPNTEPTIALLAPRQGSQTTATTTVSVVALATDDVAVERVEFFVDGSLRHTALAPPYVFDWTQATAGVRQVSATVFDDVGSASAGPRTVTWIEDQPPQVLLVEPVDAQEVVENGTVRVTIAAGDDAGMDRARLLRNGTIFRTLVGEPPYETTVPAPGAGGDLRLQAQGRDTFGHEVSTAEITLAVIPDPRTTISGRVVNELLQPVAGADVEIVSELGFFASGVSLGDGTFAVADLPTNEGELSVAATAVVEGELLRGSYLGGLATVPGGVTELGDMVLRFARPATRVVGVVTDDLGAPLAGATLRVHNRFDLLETISDAAGAFEFSRVPVAAEEGSALLDLFLSGTADVGGTLYRGRLTGPIEPIEAGETDAGTLVLAEDPGLPDPLTTAVGFVFDGAGEGMGGAEVNILTDYDLFQATSEADGSFSVLDIPAVDGDLFATVAIVVNGFRETGEAETPLAPVPGGITDFGDIYTGEGGPCDPCGIEEE